LITAHSNVTETVTRASCVVRWEGDNLADIIKFFGNIPVLVEIVEERVRISMRSSCGFTLESDAVELDLFLREGDGLAYTASGIDVIWGLVYADERPKGDDTIH